MSGEKRGKRGVGIVAGGFVIAVIGLGLIVFEAWTMGSIPLNTATWFGVGLAGVGIAVGGAGLDRSVQRA